MCPLKNRNKVEKIIGLLESGSTREFLLTEEVKKETSGTTDKVILLLKKASSIREFSLDEPDRVNLLLNLSILIGMLARSPYNDLFKDLVNFLESTVLLSNNQ